MSARAAKLDRVFGALADPTRRAIVERLAEGERSVTELAEPFAMSLAAVSKHLKVLERAGLVRRRWEGRVARCRLHAEALEPAGAWVARYRSFWDARLDALERHLERENAQTKGTKRRSR